MSNNIGMMQSLLLHEWRRNWFLVAKATTALLRSMKATASVIATAVTIMPIISAVRSCVGSFKKPPAFAKPLINRRILGERIGLLIVSVHDWNAGKELAARSGTARIVVDEINLPHELDWKCAVALDCLVVGDCDHGVFYAVATMLYAAGAASIWGQFDDGIYRLERCSLKLFPTGFYADDGPVPASRLGVALAVHRSWALMRRAGVYGTKMYDAARDAEYAKAFGSLPEKAQAWIVEKLQLQQVRAA